MNAAVTAWREEAPVCVAHRGGYGLAPENTLVAFANAIRLGCSWGELDVRATRDGSLVVIHDPTVDRTTDGTGPVAEFTLRRLKKLDAGSRFSRKFAWERIPTFGQVLRLVRGKLSLLVELKVKGVERQVVAALRKARMDRNVIVIGHDLQALMRVKRSASHIATGLLSSSLRATEAPDSLIAGARRIRAFLVPARLDVTAEGIEEAHAAGLVVVSEPAEDPAVMERLLALGIDGIVTARPDILLKVLRRRRRVASQGTRQVRG